MRQPEKTVYALRETIGQRKMNSREMKRTALDIKTEGAIFPPSAVRYINNNGPKGRKPSRSKYIKKAARL